MNGISVVINTLNEEENIARAISSVKDWADEIVVVDMHSEDKTVGIARGLGAKIFFHKKAGYVEPARNFAISKAQGEWILVLDADEEVSQGLAVELKRIAKEDKVSYVAVPRRNIVFGKWLTHSRWWPDYNVRFFRKGAVIWEREIHSVPITSGKGMDIEAEFDRAIVHHHYGSVSQYLVRQDKYSGVMAKEKHEKGERFSWQHLISKPTGEFLSRYFFGQGYKDGVHGLVLSVFQGFVEFVTYVKLWELSKFPERELSLDDVGGELKKAQREINYWAADALVAERGGLLSRIKRKFKLP